MSIEHPDLTATATTTGAKRGVPGGTTLTPGGSITVPGSPLAQGLPTSPLSDMQQRFRPPQLLDFHQLLSRQPDQASRDLDAAVQRSYENNYRLETMIACTQHGAVVVTGAAIAIPTGLSSVRSVTGSIDNGATPHNFTVSVAPSQIPGAIDIHVFQPLKKTDNTPVAATVPVRVRWVAVGGL
jgi:hypothetical protein